MPRSKAKVWQPKGIDAFFNVSDICSDDFFRDLIAKHLGSFSNERTSEIQVRLAEVIGGLRFWTHYRNRPTGGQKAAAIGRLQDVLKETLAALILFDEIVEIGDRFYVKAVAELHDGKATVLTTAFARESDDKKGMDAAQITGAASSYARKYALNGLFLIDDTKDADSEDNTAPKTSPEPVKPARTRANPPAYKSDGVKEIEAKKRIAGLILKLTDEEAPSDKKEAAQWFADNVQEFTGMSLSLATLQELENIGDELGKLFDNQQIHDQ